MQGCATSMEIDAAMGKGVGDALKMRNNLVRYECYAAYSLVSLTSFAVAMLKFLARPTGAGAVTRHTFKIVF